MPTKATLYAQREAGQSYAEIAAQHGLTVTGVRGMVSKERMRRRNLTAASPVYEAPAVVVKPNAPALTDLTYLDPATDQGVFLERLHAARADGGYASVMHICDMHFPYQHAPALDVTYQLIKHVWPKFIVVGSDAFDFAMLSSFPQDADEHEAGDALDLLQVPWSAHIDALRRASPASTLVFILGNHELRLWRFLNERAPELRRTVIRRFVEIVRAGGRVLFIGEVDAVRFGPLRVMHGNRHNLHTAESLLQDARYQLNVIAGHVHRLTYANKRGEDFAVSAITSGCLCNYPAAYMKRKTPTQRWMLGTALAEVNLRGRDVAINNLEYQLDSAAVWARFERRTFSASIPQPTGLISFEEYLTRKQQGRAA
jgi:hypothetical protein